MRAGVPVLESGFKGKYHVRDGGGLVGRMMDGSVYNLCGDDCYAAECQRGV